MHSLIASVLFVVGFIFLFLYDHQIAIGVFLMFWGYNHERMYSKKVGSFILTFVGLGGSK